MPDLSRMGAGDAVLCWEKVTTVPRYNKFQTLGTGLDNYYFTHIFSYSLQTKENIEYLLLKLNMLASLTVLHERGIKYQFIGDNKMVQECTGKLRSPFHYFKKMIHQKQELSWQYNIVFHGTFL